MISLTYIVAFDLCVLCVSVVRSTHSPARLCLRIPLPTSPTAKTHLYGAADIIRSLIGSPLAYSGP
nr:hypothetical protein [Microcystis aeruginosa]